MNIFHELKLPPLLELVWVYYKISDGQATAYTLGYWNGERWNRVSINQSVIYGEMIKNVCGWDEATPPALK